MTRITRMQLRQMTRRTGSVAVARELTLEEEHLTQCDEVVVADLEASG
jgi:hypothetical protein